MLSEYIHDKVLPALFHLTFNEPVEEDEEQSVSVALDLDSEEVKSKLKKILITHGLPSLAHPLPSIAEWLVWDSDMQQGRKDTMFMDMKNLQ